MKPKEIEAAIKELLLSGREFSLRLDAHKERLKALEEKSAVNRDTTILDQLELKDAALKACNDLLMRERQKIWALERRNENDNALLLEERKKVRTLENENERFGSGLLEAELADAKRCLSFEREEKEELMALNQSLMQNALMRERELKGLE